MQILLKLKQTVPELIFICLHLHMQYFCLLHCHLVMLSPHYQILRGKTVRSFVFKDRNCIQIEMTVK